MYSMTGYGQAKGMSPYGSFRIEISSVNHKFCEVSMRLPYEFASLEGKIRNYIKGRVKRGKLNVFFRWEKKEQSKRVEIDSELAEDYLKKLRKAGKILRLKDEAGVAMLVTLPEIVKVEVAGIESGKMWQFIRKGVAEASDSLLEMRRREGETMNKQFKKSLSVLERKLAAIEKDKDKVGVRYAKLLKKRAKKLGLKLDDGRFASEVAAVIQRMDIGEEIVRLSGHLQQFVATIRESKKEIGQKLDFIIQEMMREVNTIGAKANDLRISGKVIDIKTELHKMREQVQNVE